MQGVFALLIASSVIVQASPVADRPLSVAEVLDRWEAGANLIESYDLAVELVSKSLTVRNEGGGVRLARPGDSFPPRTHRSRVRKKGGKRFGEFGGDGKGHYAMSILDDGNLITTSMVGSNEFAVQRGVLIFGAVEYEDYDATYRTILGTTDRIAASKRRGSRLLPRDGNNYVVSVPAAKDGDLASFTWTIWLNPAKNFLPVKWTQSVVKGDRAIRDQDCAVELKEVGDGVWAPVGTAISVYHKGENSPVFGKIGGTYALRVIPEESRFNGPISDELFLAKIPTGSIVIDKIRNVVYHQGSSDPEAYLAKLATDGKKSLADLPTEARQPPPLIFVPDRPWTWTTGRVVAAFVAIALIVVAAVVGGQRLVRSRS